MEISGNPFIEIGDITSDLKKAFGLQSSKKKEFIIAILKGEVDDDKIKCCKCDKSDCLLYVITEEAKKRHTGMLKLLRANSTPYIPVPESKCRCEECLKGLSDFSYIENKFFELKLLLT